MATYNRSDGTTRFIDRSAAKLGLPSAWVDGELNDIFTILNSLTLSTNVSEWADLALTPTYISTTEFSVPGDVTDILYANRRLRPNLTGTYVYTKIVSAVYSTVTTVTVADAVLTASLNQIFYGIINSNLSESSLSAEMIPSTAADDLAATNVQAALEELEAEKIKGTDILQGFVISGLLGTDPGVSLSMTTPAGKAWINGSRVVSSGFSKTYTASKDTYDDLSDADVVTHTEVTNGAAAPAVAANSIRLQKVVTDGTEITSVTDLRELVGVINSPVVRDMARGLSVSANVTNPAYQVDVAADEIVLYDSSNLPLKLSSVSETADITASGANGLDTGSEAASTNYYLWVIFDADKRVPAALLSLSKTAPTMPSGYTYKALVGEVYNDSGSDFSYINTWDGEYFFGGIATVTSSAEPLTIDLGTVAVNDIVMVGFYMQINTASGGGAGYHEIRIAKSSGTGALVAYHNSLVVLASTYLPNASTPLMAGYGELRISTGGTLILTSDLTTKVGTPTISAHQIQIRFLKKS